MAETLQVKKTIHNATGGATVSVASKMPFDFILQLYDFKVKHEPVMGGGTREYKIAEKRHGSPTFVVRGNAGHRGIGDNGTNISHGYSLTGGIPKDFWDEFLHQNAEADYIRNGMLFAHHELASVHAEAKEKESLKSGMERMDPNNLPKTSVPTSHRPLV